MARTTFWQYRKRVGTRAWKDAREWFREKLKEVIVAVVALIAGWIVLRELPHLGELWAGALSGGIIMLTVTLYHRIRAPWKLDQEHEDELDRERDKVRTAEERLDALANSQQYKSEWRLLENRFREYQGDLEAIWQQFEGESDYNWILFGGADEQHRNSFWVTIEEAGQLLLTSAHMLTTHSEVLEQNEDPRGRWMKTLCVLNKIDLLKTKNGSGYDRKRSYITGVIQAMPRLCGHTCSILAAKEKWPRR